MQVRMKLIYRILKNASNNQNQDQLRQRYYPDASVIDEHQTLIRITGPNNRRIINRKEVKQLLVLDEKNGGDRVIISSIFEEDDITGELTRVSEIAMSA